MTTTPRIGGPLEELLERSGRFFTPGEFSKDLRTVTRHGGRDADIFYRDRWSYDKVVRSTHGVNCTGSCSWKIFVKDGVIAWEHQATDYPTTGPDHPEYEPRGCPRGASFSWYTYSPTRVRYPYVRGELVKMYREAKARLGDPVEAWADIQSDPQRRRRYQRARGKGGFVRVNWAEAAEIVAAAQVHTIKTHGPDRILGFSPIPGKSIMSFSVGARYIELLGGAMNSFYDWYADLPVASPQVFGDQTDVPESGDWWNAAYLMMWGSNVPVTRTPDAHFMAEVRYRGTKVVAISPDYADNTKFADEWMPCAAGNDGALAMAMGHVILKENYVDKQVPFFIDFARQYTDLPFLIKLEQRGDMLVPGKNLTAADLDGELAQSENAAFRLAVLDEKTGNFVTPNGSIGFRFGEDGVGKWNLELGDIVPAITVLGEGVETVEISLPSFNSVTGEGETLNRGVPIRRVGEHMVCTVFDLMLASYGIHRKGLPGQWPTGYDDAASVNTPAWQEEITGVSANQAIRVAREFAQSALDSGGRSMIIMGAGVCQWFHGDATYRAMLALLMLTGSMGRNGGGWAHYVGQEKIRPLAGFQTLAMGIDWYRPPRVMPGASCWYTHTDQWRYDGYSADKLASPIGRGLFKDKHTIDILASSVAMGWSPFFPQFNRSSLVLADEAKAAGKEVPAYVAEQLGQKKLELAVTDPDNPINWPRTLTLWRSNLIGGSGKGGEYFLQHLLGTDSNILGKPATEGTQPVFVAHNKEIPEGKLDLLVTSEFRMTSTALVSDVLLPAATWYEKADVSTTDMHPFVHSFSVAIDPPWEARSDYDIFGAVARKISELAKKHLPNPVKDVVLVPFSHDTPDGMAYKDGVENNWLATGATPIPGKTMAKVAVVERDYTALYDKWRSLGPLTEKAGIPVKGVVFHPTKEVEQFKAKFGVLDSGSAKGRPAMIRPENMVDVILGLSGTSNGRLSVEGFRQLEKRTGVKLADLAEGHEEKLLTYKAIQAVPCETATSPEWSGTESGGRRYAPFTVNIERCKPFHTLSGRMHFYVTHDWVEEIGEHLPVYRPPLDMARLFNTPPLGETVDGIGLSIRYVTPHSKWAIHSTFQDNLYMLTLGRGGPTVWMSVADAAKIGVADNDWVEAVNANGVFVGRAIVSQRIPEGVLYVHHSQDRQVDVPRTETTGKRGGNHNALTRVRVKPTHLAGGYGQNAYAFNYMGPTGNQRDEVTVIRRRRQEVKY